jgi:S1-C subfamily serine protease
MKRIALILFSLAMLSPMAFSAEVEAPKPDPARVHIEFHKKVAPAIVAVRGPDRSGTGVIISDDGLILTSSYVTGDSVSVRVWLPGNRRVNGRVIFSKKDKEVALVKIESKERLPFLPLGDSDKLQLGERTYTIGNVQGSIEADAQAALSVGVLSGRFELQETYGGHTYKGPVLETTAAVNRGLSGGPLLNRDGEVVGLVTLNYSQNTWSGLAIPINIVKKVLEDGGAWKKQ